MPSRFQTMKCAASDEFTTSTAWMRLAYSWPMRWNTRSAPVRSTRTAMPEYFASNALATRSAAGRSSDVYQTALPSFLAASIRPGVMELAGGAAAITDDANDPNARAVEPLRTSRLENLGFVIVVFSRRIFALLVLVFSYQARASPGQQAATIGRQIEPDRGSLRNVLGRRCEHAQL